MVKEINNSNKASNMNILFVTRLYSGFEKKFISEILEA